MSRAEPKRILSPQELNQAACDVYFLANEAGVRVALIGGFALQRYKSPRLTGDVDVAASGSIPGLKREGKLSFGGDKARTSLGVPVDVVVRADMYAPLYQEALDDAVGRAPAGILPVVRPEYLAAMKLAAPRLRDRDDLEFLIGARIINKRETRQIIGRHLGVYAVQMFDEAVRETKWRWAREHRD